MIHLENNKDDRYLDLLRYKTGYNPFSDKFNSTLNKELYEKARAGGATEVTLNMIAAGDYFYWNFHCPLFEELTACRRRIPMTRENLLELFIAFLNEQQSLNREEEKKYMDALSQLSALDIQQASITRDTMPQNPQNFRHLSEALVDIANLIVRYMHYEKTGYSFKSGNTMSGEALFHELANLLSITNRYYNLKSHYDACLFFNGNIKISELESICFDDNGSDFYFIEQISQTIIENQRLNRLHYFKLHSGYNRMAKEMVLRESALRTLSGVSIEKGFIKYRLRKRTLEDYTVNLDYLVSVLDFYPYYTQQSLPNQSGLTLHQMLRLHSEFVNLSTEIYFGRYPKNTTYNIEKFRDDFLPRIKRSVLKSYLQATTGFSEDKIVSYLELVSMPASASADFFSDPVMRKGEYYYFPIFSLSHPNYLHLIDHWLERSGETLEERGPAFEKYLKGQMKAVEQGDTNKFRTIEQKKFLSSKGEEEIDLLIETKTTLIIGEVKCVKYPMHNRDYYGIYSTVVRKAVKQLKRKSDFLEKYAGEFSDIYSLTGKSIVKVIILNYPFFITVGIENIPVSDGNFFLAYFKSGRMVERSFDDNDMQEHEITTYYTNEDEFCSNLESYLSNHPMVKAFQPYFEKQESEYQLPGLPKIIFSNVVSTNIEFPIKK